jgi:pimeloyl-ACP methyl ester carboxylesterase
MVASIISPELREVDVDGHLVRYRVLGAGEPLVLVHGLAGSWRWWAPVFKPLAARRTLHVVDLPHLHRGWGVAQVSAWLAYWLDAAGIGPTDIAAHSLGGLFAAELAATEPERIRRLVLVAPAGIPHRLPLALRTRSLVHALYDVRRWLPMIGADVVRSGPLSLTHGVVFVLRRDLRDELSTVQAPTLLVWGDRDRLVPFRLAQEWQRLLPSARLARMPCGHVPMLEVPWELSASILAFLDEEPVDDSGE